MKAATLTAMVAIFMGATGGAVALAKGDAGDAGDAENASVAKAHGGTVWVLGESASETSGPALSKWLASARRDAEFRQKEKDGPWEVNLVAVFKKPCLKGALTVQFFEKGDAKNVIDVYSADSNEAMFVFRGKHDLSPDLGFNKNHQYVIKVGQFLKKKFMTYATGKFTLK